MSTYKVAHTNLKSFVRNMQAVLCANILNWLDDVAARRFENDVAAVLCFLIDAANATSKEMKREMFTVIRCIHCSQHCPRKTES